MLTVPSPRVYVCLGVVVSCGALCFAWICCLVLLSLEGTISPSSGCSSGEVVARSPLLTVSAGIAFSFLVVLLCFLLLASGSVGSFLSLVLSLPSAFLACCCLPLRGCVASACVFARFSFSFRSLLFVSSFLSSSCFVSFAFCPYGVPFSSGLF